MDKRNQIFILDDLLYMIEIFEEYQILRELDLIDTHSQPLIQLMNDQHYKNSLQLYQYILQNLKIQIFFWISFIFSFFHDFLSVLFQKLNYEQLLLFLFFGSFLSSGLQPKHPQILHPVEGNFVFLTSSGTWQRHDLFDFENAFIHFLQHPFLA